MTAKAGIKPAVLYVSYDGMLEPLGQSQVLSYMERLAGDYAIHIISFEKASDWNQQEKRQAIEERIASSGLNWHPLRYHKSPSVPATLYDVACGFRMAVKLIRKHGIRLIHARSLVPALIALMARRVTGRPFLFDMRGLWADERVDAGIWPAGGIVYRNVKSLEKTLLLSARQIVTLTRASQVEIQGFDFMKAGSAPITVIPTCADLDRFSPRPDGGAEPSRHPLTIGFVGAASTWSLFDQVLVFAKLIQEQVPEARLLVVNRSEHDFIRTRVAAAGFDSEKLELVAAEHRDVPNLIRRMSIGTAVRMASYSQIACAPTKLAEYLGCGVPALVNRGVGDVEQIVEENQVGVVLRGFSPAEMRAAVRSLLELCRDPGLAQRCRAVAEQQFALSSGVEQYRKIYRHLLGDHGSSDVTNDAAEKGRKAQSR